MESTTAFVSSIGLGRQIKTSTTDRHVPKIARIANSRRWSTWKMNTSADSPKPVASTSPSSDSQTPPTTSTESDDISTIDPEVLIARAKAVFSDLSDRPLYYSKIGGYVVGALILVTILRAIVSAIDSLPVLPAALELVGLGYSAWFVWRYVLFRESRAELLDEIDDFLGRTRPGGKSGE